MMALRPRTRYTERLPSTRTTQDISDRLSGYKAVARKSYATIISEALAQYLPSRETISALVLTPRLPQAEAST
jgi:hypothetical protein